MTSHDGPTFVPRSQQSGAYTTGRKRADPTADEARELVAAYAARVRPGRCVRCGAPFVTVEPSRRYCSHACRQADYRARHG